MDIFIRSNEAVEIYRKVKEFNEESFKQIVSSAKPFGFRTYFKGYAKTKDNTVKFYANKAVNYISRGEVKVNPEWIDKYKVLISYAYGMGKSAPFQVINKPFLAEPNSCCSETYLVIGPFDDKETAENVISYMNTRFFRFMVFLKKNTQHGTAKVYQLVPMQDFSQSWNDEKLYAKYGLNSDEIAFIESMVRPMERTDVE
ncbi:hypothetical protein N8E87_11780 [Avibacterium paragallinarum]|uniref:hypothetical protein n=1 Tax=Avibacterium paragallinarum TaxID=728 RepID=UPI0021F70294|nr:hypothetical protein [Avibacterium paragallinarum]UXN36815.1 hypothetical protein N8E87_11780 [Avibacterium paragallinarum]